MIPAPSSITNKAEPATSTIRQTSYHVHILVRILCTVLIVPAALFACKSTNAPYHLQLPVSRIGSSFSLETTGFSSDEKTVRYTLTNKTAKSIRILTPTEGDTVSLEIAEGTNRGKHDMIEDRALLKRNYIDFAPHESLKSVYMLSDLFDLATTPDQISLCCLTYEDGTGAVAAHGLSKADHVTYIGRLVSSPFLVEFKRGSVTFRTSD